MSPKGITSLRGTIIILSVDYIISWILFFLESSFLDALHSSRVVIPLSLTMIGRDATNRIITNPFEISDIASSAVFTECSDVTII